MLNHFFHENNNTLSFTREQASQFAKEVAGDYNPLHNTDAKRFCVPGDLLFAVVLLKYGISQTMQFSFDAMITEKSIITLPQPSDTLVFSDDKKAYVTVNRSGDNNTDPACVESIIKQYVAFSGEAFPHILVPAMSAQKVMINPKRPMVMYQSMAVDFDRTDIQNPVLEPLAPIFSAEGKRGSLTLPFHWKDGDELVGKGEKIMLVSGIVDYDKPAMDELIEHYNQSMG
ncbi:DUF3581 family protein [Gilvimarinus sp. 1_MG-2023]|uniref:DUF3581 family protein n=1 Tax=Gilvimarinus sp. 1_MG-2023 TaxID=3062638 RepID=UPI0026E211E6|nr:DUF3581 family protein [Gilvimarinus sp. 1_MG-2023]MDO6746707.1 DUF3581 family protein [Gilvimarinus sp. 1_MG-2023]